MIMNEKETYPVEVFDPKIGLTTMIEYDQNDYRHLFPRLIITARVIKKNKKLCIECVESGEILYTPPDFMKFHNRDSLIELANKFHYKDEIFNHIMEFESNYDNR